MLVAVPAETAPDERRVALVPDAVRALVRAELDVAVEAGAGLEAGFENEAYEQAGARLEPERGKLLDAADVVLKVRAPRPLDDGRHEVDGLRSSSVLIGFLRPLDEPKLAQRLAERGVTSFAMELMPRITRAQAMDALSSQSNIAGYRAVVLAAQRLPRLFPMMVTAAGTISPARVFVIGAGVAGLQAIATARRLGAVVEAYDMRPTSKDEVKSIGGRFVELPLEVSDAEDAGGYARAQSEEFYARQRQLLSERAAAADVVITTALVPGRRAPELLDEDGVRAMRRGSVIVDLAAEQGGNCTLTKPGEVEAHGVTILGPTNLPSQAPFHASQMYARNVTDFVLHLVQDGELKFDLDDEITRGSMLTHEGKVFAEAVRAKLEAAGGG
jgi:NAD(P) transhydrogenase subunit alpha